MWLVTARVRGEGYRPESMEYLMDGSDQQVFKLTGIVSEAEIAEALGIPYDEVIQTALSPVAYTIGMDFKPAKGRGLESALHVDRW